MAQARHELGRRIVELQRALADATARLAAEAPGEPLPGQHLLVESGGGRALVASGGVAEVLPLVALAPLPGAPRGVAGSFVLRGAPVVAVDLAPLLGSPRTPALDAQLVVLAREPLLALLIDRVAAVVDAPLLVGDSPADDLPASALCRVKDALVPLLDVERLAASLAGVRP